MSTNINLRTYIGLIFLTILTLNLPAQSFFANNQSPRFGLLDRSNGLKSLSISSIQQDKYGFLWFGTKGGLSRYDGKNIVTYTHDPFNSNSIPNDLVQTLYYDREENVLWIGTYSGVSRFDIDKDEFLNFNKDSALDHSLSHNIVTAIAKGPKGDIWIGTLGGLNRYSIKNGSISIVETENPAIRALTLDESKKLWIGSYGGLSYWDSSLQKIINSKIDLPSLNVMAIKEPEPGRLLLGMWGGGLMEYWPESGKTLKYDLPDNNIYTVLESRDGTKWAGSWGEGLWAKPMNKESVFFKDSKSSELKNSVIYSMFEDDAGLIWIGTNGGGVHFLSPRRRNLRKYYHDSDDDRTISKGRIIFIMKATDKLLYLGLYNGGLNIINESNGIIEKYSHNPDVSSSLSNNIVNSVLEDSKGHLWVATSDGLDLFNKDTKNFSHWSDIHPDRPLSHNIVYNITEDSLGRFWIGYYGGGLDRYDPENNELVNFKYDKNNVNSILDNIVYSIIESSTGDIWIATNDGLSRFISETNGFINYKHDCNDNTTISSNNLRSLVEDSKGRIWIGSYSGGLNLYNKEEDSFSHYTTRDGLSSNSISAIVEGDDGRIWVSTNAGISIIDTEINYIEIIDERDGLFGVNFNKGSYKRADGSIFFGGKHGITSVNSSRRYSNLHPPTVQITDILIQGTSVPHMKKVYNGEKFSFEYKENFISFEFIGLDFEAPIRNRYMYKLEGLDTHWIDNGNRNYASYPNLSPGRYTFRVKASNNDNLWSEKDATVSILIKSPWYLQWWAYFLYIVSAFLVFSFLWNYKESKLLKFKNRELEYTNKLLEKSNDDLGKLTIVDELTGLYNRRHFNLCIKNEINRAIRSKTHFALLMVDIDYFKHFNDTYGHITGDKVLKIVADVFLNSLPRNTDIAFRYGGEEFVIILYNTDINGAVKVAEDIHQTIRNNGKNLKSKITPITVSIGIHSQIPKSSDTITQFVANADEALYRAKRLGRNRTEIWEKR